MAGLTEGIWKLSVKALPFLNMKEEMKMLNFLEWEFNPQPAVYSRTLVLLRHDWPQIVILVNNIRFQTTVPHITYIYLYIN